MNEEERQPRFQSSRESSDEAMNPVLERIQQQNAILMKLMSDMEKPKNQNKSTKGKSKNKSRRDVDSDEDSSFESDSSS